MTIVPATSYILREFYGEHRTCRAFALIEDGTVYAVWGFYVQNNHAVVFSDIHIERKKYAKTIVKEAKKLLRLAKAKNLPLYAKADSCVKESKRFLDYLGFEQVKEGLYLWQG